MLSREPERCFEKGTPISKSSKHSRTREKSLWIFESNRPSSAPLHEHIESIVELLESRTSQLDQWRDKMEMDIFCRLEVLHDKATNGFWLEPDLIKRLAEFPSPLIVDALSRD